MDNKEDILDALDEFSRKPTPKIPLLLDQYLHRIATTGETIFPWNKLKPLFVSKLETCMEEFHERAPTDKLPPCPNVENITYKEMKDNLLDAVRNFNSAPFTIQRLCELITEPHKHYKRTDKFMRGIEKNLLVVSCVDSSGTKIVNEGKILNGLETNGEAKTPSRKSSCNFLRLFAPPPAPSNSPVGANAHVESRLPESSTSTPLSPVCLWPIASRFISNNGDGPWPQVAAAAAASSAPLEMSSVSSESSSKPSTMSPLSRLHPAPETSSTSSASEKSMEVDETPCSSSDHTAQIPSTLSTASQPQEKPVSSTTSTTIETVSTPDSKGAGDAVSSTAVASSTQEAMTSEEARIPEAEDDKSETIGKEAQPADSAESEVTSEVKQEESVPDSDSSVKETEATSSEAESSEKPSSPSEKSSSEVSQSVEETQSDSAVSTELPSNSVTGSSSSLDDSVGQTAESSSEKYIAPSPPGSDCVTSSENSSSSEKSEDISPSPSSSTSSKEESKDNVSRTEEDQSNSSSILDSTTPSESEAPSDEAMEQD